MTESPMLTGKRILLLEDDDDSRDSMAMMLRLAGADVVPTAIAEDALAALCGGAFDALVTDVAMPGRSGFWLVGQIRQLPAQAHVPVLAVTGHPFPREGVLRAGFNDQLRKPVLSEVLCETLAQLVGSPNMGA